MKFRSIFPLMLLALQSALIGQDAPELMRKGDEALSAGLWEVAALHFNECLTNTNLNAADKSQAALRLAESWIREGKPADALDLLGQSFVTPQPETLFWKGQALTGLGRYSEAVEAFSLLQKDPAALYRHEAGFTKASLQLALGQPEAALETLSSLANNPDTEISAKARLHQVEVLLDLGRAADARKAMPEASAIAAEEQPLAAFLEAQLLLTEARPADAATAFQRLVDQPQGQSLFRRHAAAIGLANSLHASGNPESATNFLLSFIQGQPDSPLIEDMFNRLLDWLPESPTANEPILERLAQWITPPELPATGMLATLESDAIAAWPDITPTDELLAYSLFTRAVGLHRIGTPESRTKARRLLTQLRVEMPDHILANRALFQTARWALEDGFADRAFGMLDTLRETAKSPALRGEAAFLEARTAYSQGNKEQAIRLFDEAAKSLDEQQAGIAKLNAAIARLLNGGAGSAILVLQQDLPENSALTNDFELERALSVIAPDARKTALEEFLTRHPDHPRVAEARLAAAEAALVGPNPDLNFARTQLDTLAADPEKQPGLDSTRIAWIRLRITDLSNDPAATIAMARSVIEQHPNEPEAAEAAFILGQNLFQTHSYNDAHMVLKKLAESDTDSGRAQAALLLAARSAALVSTSQSQQEALILFDKAIESKGSVAPIAMLEKARLMIDMNRLSEASAFLRKWFDSLQKTDPLHLPAGLLLGEAIYAQGSVNPHSLTEALAVYDQLLIHKEDLPMVFNRLQYLRGRTLEQIPDEKDPSRKREKQAFIAYYSVLETDTPPAEWHYFELCGFRALALLEKAGRWPAAIACAKKIASFKGPRAEEAANRASQLQLKHMIWED